MRGPATAQVIQFRPRGEYRPKADDLALELAARQQEEQEWSDDLRHLVNRLRLMADGPVARATVAAVDQALNRHARRWAPTSPEAA